MGKDSPTNATNVSQTIPAYMSRAHAEILSGVLRFADDNEETTSKFMDLHDNDRNLRGGSYPYPYNMRSVVEQVFEENPYVLATALNPDKTIEIVEAKADKFEAVVDAEHLKEKTFLDDYYTSIANPTAPASIATALTAVGTALPASDDVTALDVMDTGNLFDNFHLPTVSEIASLTPSTPTTVTTTLTLATIDNPTFNPNTDTVTDIGLDPIDSITINSVLPAVVDVATTDLATITSATTVLGVASSANVSQGVETTADIVDKEVLDFSYDPITAYEGVLDTSEFEAATEPEFLRSRSQFESAMYEVNAIQTSAYVIGLALRDIERSKQIALAAKSQMMERGNGILQYKIAAATEDARLKQLYMQLKAEIAKLNAQLATTVSQENTQMTNAVSQFNAQLSTSVSQENARLSTTANQFNTQLDVTANQFNVDVAAKIAMYNSEAKNKLAQFNKQYEMTVSQLNGQYAFETQQIQYKLTNSIAESNMARKLEIVKLVSQLTQEQTLTKAQIQLETCKVHAAYDSELVKINSEADLEIKKLTDQLEFERLKANALMSNEFDTALTQILAQLQIADQQSVNSYNSATYSSTISGAIEVQSNYAKVGALEASVYSTQIQAALAKMQTASQMRLAYVSAKGSSAQLQIETAKTAYLAKREQMQQDLEYDLGQVTWELEALRDRAAVIGASNGAPMFSKKPSQLASAISSALSTGANVGMSLGMATGSPIIALIGAGIGAAGGFLSNIFA